MPIIARSLERAFVFAFLAIFAGILWPPGTYFFGETTNQGTSNIYDFVTFSILIPFLAIAFFASRAQLGRLMRSAWPVLTLCALAFISTFWAEDPLLVFRRAGTVTLTTLFAVYLTARGDIAPLIATLVKVYALAALLSLLLIAVAPDLATKTVGEMYVHSWRGVFTDKNELGLACAIGVIVSVYAFATRLGPRWLSGFTIGACAVLLYGSESRTPEVALAIVLYIGLVASVLRRRSGLALATSYAVIVIGLIGAAAVALDWDQLLGLLGRDPTFTNRTEIWQYALAFIARKPWLGYGFGGFWRFNGVEANQFWTLIQNQIPHAHNGWLELGLSLGIVGIGLGALVWCATIYRALRALQLNTRHAAFCLGLLAGMFAENLTEYEFLRQGRMLWVLFVVVSTYLGNELIASHRTQAAPAERLLAGAPVLGGFAVPRSPVET